jgi:hypothetical protein
MKLEALSVSGRGLERLRPLSLRRSKPQAYKLRSGIRLAAYVCRKLP